jgi:transcriptional regulator with XRE-family HTH domain
MNGVVVIGNHHGQIVAEYRKRRKWSQLRLAEELGVDLSTVQRMEKKSVIKSEKRRQLLVGLLGIPAVLLDVTPARQVLPTSSVQVNQDQMAFFESVMDMKWQTYHLAGPLAAAQGIDLWLQEINNFAHAAHGTIWQQRALSLLCRSYKLQGSIYGDRDYARGQAAMQTAYSIAEEIGDLRLMAETLTDQGIMLQRQGKLLEGVAYEEHALELINGSGFVRLRGYILQVLANSHARLGHKQESLRAIGLAERTLEDNDEYVQGKSHFESTGISVLSSKGRVVLALGDYNRALILIEKNLAACDPTMTPHRARLIIQQAQAHYHLGNIEESLFYAEQGLVMARSIGSARFIERIALLQTELASSKWKGERGVARLGGVLAVQ